MAMLWRAAMPWRCGWLRWAGEVLAVMALLQVGVLRMLSHPG